MKEPEDIISAAVMFTFPEIRLSPVGLVERILNDLGQGGYVVQHKAVGKRVRTTLGFEGTVTAFEQDENSWSMQIDEADGPALKGKAETPKAVNDDRICSDAEMAIIGGRRRQDDGQRPRVE